MSTSEKIIKILRELALVNDGDGDGDGDSVDENETFVSMGADSLDELELLMAVEEAFEIEISGCDAEKITTIKQAVDYLEAL